MSGVLHQNKGKSNYDLRRYFPSAALANIVEQFWFVDWSLQTDKEHLQQNLPDPNFHLVFENGSARLIGPVSKVFSYRMKKSGAIVGVKLTVGSLNTLLDEKIRSFVNREIPAQDCFGEQINELALKLANNSNDEQRCEMLHTFFEKFPIKVSTLAISVNKQLTLIRETEHITSVQYLSELTNISTRSLQRNFIKYLGLSPKWLIRKYRLHQALSLLESGEIDIADLVVQLNYTDQSHLIHDFKDMLGITPNTYISKQQ